MEKTTTTETATTKKSAAHGADDGLQEKVLKQIKDLGDSLERVGEKIEKGGWETVGQAIYKLGNTLEHLKEKTGMKPAGLSTNRKYTDAEFDQKSKKFSGSTVGADQAKTEKTGANESKAM